MFIIPHQAKMQAQEALPQVTNQKSSVNSQTTLDKTSEISNILRARAFETFDITLKLTGMVDVLKFNPINSPIDYWILNLLKSCASDDFSSLTKYADDLSLLTPQSQLTLLSEALSLIAKYKTLIAKIEIDAEIVSEMDAKIEWVDAKLQECKKNNPDLSPSPTIDTTKEKKLEKVLKNRENEKNSRDAEKNPRDFVKVAAMLGGLMLIEYLVSRKIMLIGALALTASIMYNNTIIPDGLPAGKFEKLGIALKGHIYLPLKSAFDRFSGKY